MSYFEGWPELYVYTVSDRIFDDFPARNIVCIWFWFWPTLHIFISYIPIFIPILIVDQRN